MDIQTSSSPSNTWKIAAEFFQGLEKPAIVALHGNLGAGKTCFTQGLALAAGVTEPVCSPTYTLISEYQGDIPFHHIDLYRLSGPQEALDLEYQGDIPFHHIDLYRLSGPQEALDLGLDEYLETDGITVIEWAERAAELIPPSAIHVRLERGDDEQVRIIEIVENPL